MDKLTNLTLLRYEELIKDVTLLSCIMKKYLLSTLLALIFAFASNAQQYIVENYLGINCLAHEVKNNETFYEVAQRYFVRPSTLAMVNGKDNSIAVSSGEKLYIPLTETNFYTINNLESSKFTFEPVYCVLDRESTMDEIETAYFISEQNIRDWNKGDINIQRGNKLIIGWLKYEKDLAIAKAPSFVRKEKILFGNAAEKEEARNEMGNYEIAKNTNSKIPDYSIPATSIPENSRSTKQENDGLTALAVSKKKQASPQKVKKKKQSLKKEVSKKVNKPAETIKSTDVSTPQITKKEKQFLLGNKKEKQTVKKDNVWKKVKGLTKNSYSRDKNRYAKKGLYNPKKKVERPELASKKPAVVKQKKAKPLVKKKAAVVKKKVAQVKKKKVVAKKKVAPAKKKKFTLLKKKKVAKEKTPVTTSKKDESLLAKKVLKNKKPEVINKVGGEETQSSDLNEESEKPIYVENKLLRLTLLKSIKGRANFFYSGTAGAKFYVFTNLAGKGGIIKLTNLNNNKFILAKVIGPMPEVDRKRGYIIKLSDNSRRILDVKSKSFSVKVNY